MADYLAEEQSHRSGTNKQGIKIFCRHGIKFRDITIYQNIHTLRLRVKFNMNTECLIILSRLTKSTPIVDM